MQTAAWQLPNQTMQAKEMIMIYVKKKKDDDDDDDVEEGPAPTHQPGAVPGKRVLDKRCRSRRTGGTRKEVFLEV